MSTGQANCGKILRCMIRLLAGGAAFDTISAVAASPHRRIAVERQGRPPAALRCIMRLALPPRTLRRLSASDRRSASAMRGGMRQATSPCRQPQGRRGLGPRPDRCDGIEPIAAPKRFGQRARQRADLGARRRTAKRLDRPKRPKRRERLKLRLGHAPRRARRMPQPHPRAIGHVGRGLGRLVNMPTVP